MAHGWVAHLLQSYGLVAVFAVVMCESLGVPLPGESILIAAAVYAGATGRLSITSVVAVAAVAAIVGDNIGYLIGRFGGYRLLERHGTKIRINHRRMKIGRLLFLRRGGVIVFWGRFVSVLRTYAAFLAGTNAMPWRRFLVFNAAGGAIWASAFGFAYYAFGQAATRFSTPVDIAIGVVALAITVGVALWARRHEDRLGEQAERVFPGSIAEYAPGELDRRQERELAERAREVARE